jgi:hypothetical protein
MVTELLFASYLVIGLFVYFKSLKYFDKQNKDGDPEGLDALVSCAAGLFWPLSIPIFVLWKLFSG